MLHRTNINIKLPKCEVFTPRIRHLWPIIEPGEVRIDVTVVHAFEEAQLPRNKEELRSFLGLCNVYCRFLSSCSHIAAHLSKWSKKEAPERIVSLAEEEQEPFKKLRNYVTTPPVLAIRKQGLLLSMYSDALMCQVGADLFQTDTDGQRRHFSY